MAVNLTQLLVSCRTYHLAWAPLSFTFPVPETHLTTLTYWWSPLQIAEKLNAMHDAFWYIQWNGKVHKHDGLLNKIMAFQRSNTSSHTNQVPSIVTTWQWCQSVAPLLKSLTESWQLEWTHNQSSGRDTSAHVCEKIQKGSTEEKRPALNAGGAIPGTLLSKKAQREKPTLISLSLCCHPLDVSRQPSAAVPSLPRWTDTQTGQNKPFLLSCITPVFCSQKWETQWIYQ